MKMERRRAPKASYGSIMVPLEVKNLGRKNNKANGGTSGTPETVRQSQEKSSGLSSHCSPQGRKKSQKVEKPEIQSNGDKINSTTDSQSENNRSESKELEKQKNVNQKASRLATRARKNTLPVGKKYILRSLSNGVRVLRPRSNKSSKVLSKSESHSPEISAEKSKGRRRKHKKKKHVQQDELSRIRKRVKYLLFQISFEQNMIDAYSSEGWKGQSQEKIRPEKELQKAASKIKQCKLAIREAFQQIQSLCLEGSLEESAFDSEGQVNSEDIFCAKCRSKDLFPDNDIILCDGACDRGYHQKCLEPPLATEDIPPGDEGWLCPGCDCKLDCVDLINDYLGTAYELEDSWEQFFVEAAAIAVEDETPLDLEDMPSDDTEDGDYDPDGLELSDGIDQEEGTSSEESGSTRDAGNSSDSSSDEVSESEEGFEGDEDSENKDVSEVSMECDSEHFSGYLVDSGKKNLKMFRDKKALASSKQPKNLDPDESDNVSSPGKRHRQEVDYKKLHDEMFGLDTSDKSMSEDDEEWGPGKRSKKWRPLDVEQDSSSASKGKKHKNVSVTKKKAKVPHVKSPKDINILKSSLSKNGESAVTKEEKHNESDNNADIFPLNFKSPTKQNASQQQQYKTLPVSAKRNASSRLSTPVLEKLRRVFGENRFPSRSMKEDLAEELGVSFKKVHKWFDNARNSLRSPAGKKQADVTMNQDSNKLTAAEDRIVAGESKDLGSVKKWRKNSKRFSEQGKKTGSGNHGNKDKKPSIDTGSKFLRK